MTVRSLRLLPGPVLLFGGPYSNLSATKAMRRWAESNGIAPGNCICTGDVVAYGARPEETVNLIRDSGINASEPYEREFMKFFRLRAHRLGAG